MLIILVQNPKGGGLGAGFGGGSANLMGGVKQTTDFLEKATWTLITAIFLLSIVSNAFLPSADNGSGTPDQPTKTEELINDGE